jgi:hypothetical protein
MKDNSWDKANQMPELPAGSLCHVREFRMREQVRITARFTRIFLFIFYASLSER